MFNWNDNPDLNITPLIDVHISLMVYLLVTLPIIPYPRAKQSLPGWVKQLEAMRCYFYRDCYIGSFVLVAREFKIVKLKWVIQEGVY